MAKEKKAQIQLDPFTEWAHKTGRAFMLMFVIYMVAIPFIMCAVYGCMPTFKQILPGAVSILAIMAPMSLAEVGSYTPILGASSYLTFASGNLMNLKIPCIVEAQRIAKVEQSTVEGEAIALIATAVSSAVTIILLFVGMFMLSFLTPVLSKPAIATASNYLLPSLFGCMSLGLLGSGSGKTKIKNRLLPALIPALLIAVLTIMGIASSGIAGILMIIMIPIIIGIARIMYKKGIVAVVPNPAYKAPEAAEEKAE